MMPNANRKDQVHIIFMNYDQPRNSVRFQIELICNNFSTITTVEDFELNKLEKLGQDKLSQLKTSNNIYIALPGSYMEFDNSTSRMLMTKLQHMVDDLKLKQTNKSY